MARFTHAPRIEQLESRDVPSTVVMVYDPHPIGLPGYELAQIRPQAFVEVEDTRELLGKTIEPYEGYPITVNAFRVVEAGDYFWDPRVLEPSFTESGRYHAPHPQEMPLTFRIETPAPGSTLEQQRAALDQVLVEYSTIPGIHLTQIYEGGADVTIGVWQGQNSAAGAQSTNIWFSWRYSFGPFREKIYDHTLRHEVGHVLGYASHRWILPSVMSGDGFGWQGHLSYVDRLDFGLIFSA